MSSVFCFVVFLLCFVVSSSAQVGSSSFGFKRFDQNSKYFWSEISLLGDSRVVDNGSFLQMTGFWNYSSGKVLYKQPIKLFDSYSRKKSSFGTFFVFSIESDNHRNNNNNNNNSRVGVLDFVIVRNGVEFVTKIDSTHVGEKLQCWIDFEASSKRMEVRVTKLGKNRPVSPLISHQIDLCSMFKDQEIFIGLASSNGNSKQMCRLYSWSFKLRPVPNWMHSHPLDPEGFKKNKEVEEDEEEEEPVVVEHKRNGCALRVFAALVFGTGCGALGAFIVLCVCTVISSRKPVAPEEFVAHSHSHSHSHSHAHAQPVVFDCDKLKVIVIDKSDSGRK